MDIEHLNHLSPPLRERAINLEEVMGLEIQVRIDVTRASLACNVEVACVEILTPANDYFPEPSVFHELLHIERFKISGIPQIRSSDKYLGPPQLDDGLKKLDNALEHLIIVPCELQTFPARYDYWVDKHSHHVGELRSSQRSDEEIVVWGSCAQAFARHVLNNQKLVNDIELALTQRSLHKRLHKLTNKILENINVKRNLVLYCIEEIGITREQVCFKDVRDGTIEAL